MDWQLENTRVEQWDYLETMRGLLLEYSMADKWGSCSGSTSD